EVDHLVFEDRRTQRSKRARIAAVVFPDLLLLARHHARLRQNGLRELIFAHLDVVLLADFGDHQSEPHAALGDAAIFLARFLLGGAFIRESAALLLEIVLDRGPDALE